MAYVVLRVERRWREIQISYVREEETGKREREPNLFYPGFSFQFWKKFDFLCFKLKFFMFYISFSFTWQTNRKMILVLLFSILHLIFCKPIKALKPQLSKRIEVVFYPNVAKKASNFFFQPNKKMKEQNSINNLLKINF